MLDNQTLHDAILTCKCPEKFALVDSKGNRLASVRSEPSKPSVQMDTIRVNFGPMLRPQPTRVTRDMLIAKSYFLGLLVSRAFLHVVENVGLSWASLGNLAAPRMGLDC